MAYGLNLEKTPPSAVSNADVDSLKTGTEDIFQQIMSVQLHDGGCQGLESGDGCFPTTDRVSLNVIHDTWWRFPVYNGER
jgi:hypothetical protein